MPEYSPQRSQELLKLLQSRYTCKRFDPSKKLSDEQIATLKEALRLSISSINSQPWHFFVANSDSDKKRIASCVADFNENKILKCSHVFVICGKQLTSEGIEEYLDRFYAQRPELPCDRPREIYRQYFDYKLQHPNYMNWVNAQAHIALSSLLFSCAYLGIDMTPMEGFSQEALDAELGLNERGLFSLLLAPVGFHSSDDANQPPAAPKIRWQQEEIFSRGLPSKG